ncbi:hypothetical protein [Nocardia wallacei]|uniref:hypothetical protein n=1 Tax=Nocardia wallacei TaxID=480035 RepID=UPI002455C602|nr:hypothetical protein [Nocardia wallacei]
MTDPAGTNSAEDAIGRALAAHAPAGWDRAHAEFAMTVSREAGHIVYSLGANTISMNAPESVLSVIRQIRTTSYRQNSGLWWRMLVELDESGAISIEYDYGNYPFPPGQLFEPDQYRADLATFPRPQLPVWLGAYVGHADRQLRTPQRAAEQACADRAGQVWATLADNEFPELPAMWARWATIAAAFVAARSDWGPRMMPATAVFEGSGHGGATLHLLPGSRAVLSGGVWNASTLDAVYNGGQPMPNLYAGAPNWVADSVLNPRAATGLLTFCYWWEAGHWYRGQSPTAEDCATAVPGMWTSVTVVEIIMGLVPDGDMDEAADLIAAAEAGTVTRDRLEAVFRRVPDADIEGALHQCLLAGLLTVAPRQIPAAEAISRVRDYVVAHRMDTTGYPLSQLTAVRLNIGWMVHAPAPDSEPMVGRAIFYVADDGVLELSSTSVAPPIYIADFERRFAERHRSVIKTVGTGGD